MKMKTVYRTANVVLLTVLAAGCGNDMNTGRPADAWVPVEITGAGITAGVETRATTITGGSIGVFRTGSGYTEQYEKYTYDGGWKPSASANAIIVGGGDATVCAYYPYDDAATRTGTGFTLEAGGWSEQKDLCYATTGAATVSNKHPQVSFAMKRAYARIKLSITRTSNYEGDCNVRDVNIKDNNGFVTSCVLDISNSISSGDVNTGGGWTNSLDLGNVGNGTANTAYDVLIPPQPINGGLTITLPIDGMNRSVTVPAGQFTDGKLAAGKQYTISLIIANVTVTLNGGINIINDYTVGNNNLQNDDPVDI